MFEKLFKLFKKTPPEQIGEDNKNTIYNFVATRIDGEKFDFSSLKGKKVLIVNTASACGLTPQYQDLQRLYEQFASDNFELIAFPSNDFGGQEPLSNDELIGYCQKNFNVSFPLMQKVGVVQEPIHPLYKWLTFKSENGEEDRQVSWNFHKFLIDERGNFHASLEPDTLPFDERITSWIKSS